MDNRPLRFEEFMKRSRQILYVSATPAKFEIANSVVGNEGYKETPRLKQGEPEVPARLPRISGGDISPAEFDVTSNGKDLIVEQIIRPTGLLDPLIEIKPLAGQIDETIELCRQRVERQQRVLITTLTKRTAEDLTDYLRDTGLKVRYVHSEIDAIQRVEILRSLRAGEFDILVGINLLREGLDLPEVSLVCILDADKEGYLRSETSLIQTAGRAARHVDGQVVLFCDKRTKSIEALLRISSYRREKQMEYNAEHGIVPRSVKRAVQESLQMGFAEGGAPINATLNERGNDKEDYQSVIHQMQQEMLEASAALEFERAALLRDQIQELKNLAEGKPTTRAVSYRDDFKKKKKSKKH
jgi:excinuclease ABC subunit B